MVGPATPLLSGHFDVLIPASLDAHVRTIASWNFRCFALPISLAPWLAMPQRKALKRRIEALKLPAWHFNPGHVFDFDDFSRPKPLWDAALTYHAAHVEVARDSGMKGIIIAPPPDHVGSMQDVEQHTRDLTTRCPGAVWLSNSANPAKRVGTATDLADFCRASGAKPCLNAPAHAYRSGAQLDVDGYKQALRELGPDTILLLGNLVVRGANRAWELYDPTLDETMLAPVVPLVRALDELGRLDTPILVHGVTEHDASKVLAVAQKTLQTPHAESKE